MKKVGMILMILLITAIGLAVFSCTPAVAEPKITCDPAQTSIGGQVTLKGSGFAPNEPVIIIANAALTGRGAVAVVMVQTQVDGNGAFSEAVPIPPPAGPGIPPKYAPAQYTVRAMGKSLVATATLVVN